MAIIYSYPKNINIQGTDVIVGTSTVISAGKAKIQTKSFPVVDLATYINSFNTLDSVLTNGNISLLNASIGILGLYDTTETDYALLRVNDSQFVFEDINGVAAILNRTGITFLGDGISAATIYLPPYAISHQYDLPDQDGIIALTTDILPAPGLNDVLLVGNVSNIDATVGKLYLGNAVGARPYIYGDKQAINFYNNAGQTYGRFTTNEISIKNGLYSSKIVLDTLTLDRTYTFPNKDGVVAMTSDIGVFSINALSGSVQTLTTGATGTDFAIVSSGTDHKFNLPAASAVNTGKLRSTDFNVFNGKQNALNGTGFVKISGTTISYDNSTYQPLLTNPITGTGTTNYLPKFTGASALGNSLIYDNGTNVGIGTTAPTQKLTIDAGTSTTSLANFLASGGSGTRVGFLAGYGAIVGATSANATYVSGSRINFVSVDLLTEFMRITSAGNVGIGTTAPTAKLSIKAPGALSTDIALQVRNSADTADLVIVNGLGNVGIGTTTPTSKLQVVGLVEYATNALAITGGLTVGAFYHTAGVVKVVI